MRDTRPKGIDKGRLKALVKAGHTDREVAAVLGVHRTTARWHRLRFRLAANRRQRPWTADEVATCRRILAGGGSLWNAARAVKRTPAAVRVALTRHTTGDQRCSF